MNCPKCGTKTAGDWTDHAVFRANARAEAAEKERDEARAECAAWREWFEGRPLHVETSGAHFPCDAECNWRGRAPSHSAGSALLDRLRRAEECAGFNAEQSAECARLKAEVERMKHVRIAPTPEYPEYIGRDGGEKVTPRMIVEAMAPFVERDDRTGAADVIDRMFICGAYKDTLKPGEMWSYYLCKDIRGLIISAYQIGLEKSAALKAENERMKSQLAAGRELCDVFTFDAEPSQRPVAQPVRNFCSDPNLVALKAENERLRGENATLVEAVTRPISLGLNDILVIEAPGTLSEQASKSIRETIGREFGRKVLLLSGGMKLASLKIEARPTTGSVEVPMTWTELPPGPAGSPAFCGLHGRRLPCGECEPPTNSADGSAATRYLMGSLTPEKAWKGWHELERGEGVPLSSVLAKAAPVNPKVCMPHGNAIPCNICGWRRQRWVAVALGLFVGGAVGVAGLLADQWPVVLRWAERWLR